MASRKSELAIFGEPTEGEVLRAQGLILGAEGAQNRCTFQWGKRVPEQVGSAPTPIADATGQEYESRFEDIGFIISCTVNPGTGEPPITVETQEKIKVAPPQIRDLRIEGGPYHSSVFSIAGRYVGGQEGESRFKWFKVKNGAATHLEFALKRTYDATVDDVSCNLRIEYTPIRSDGVEGETRTAETGPVKIDPVVGKMIKNNIIIGAAAFNCKSETRNGMQDAQIIVNDRELRVVIGGKTKKKDYLGTHIQTTLDLSTENRFLVKFGEQEPFVLIARDNNDRDEIALSVRSFCVMSGDREAQKRAKKLGQR
eukprot:comp19426_c0_seq1/m.36801 comp19426_c0_seq1/g.36801  ORF comp19426_c0_seq1/g.36801 comp19426_c0_seq1/m.36801 type:complete len:312 (-) comp19426_c0_seq1:42-977(-)